jgi:hypothetical protein
VITGFVEPKYRIRGGIALPSRRRSIFSNITN